MSTDRVVKHLQDAALAEQIRSSISHAPNAKPADVERVVGWVMGLRDDLVALVQEVGDPDEVRTTLAINYIELKTRWIAMNTKLNYQIFRTGANDSVVMMRGTAISTLLARVEDLLQPSDIDQITEFLAQPVSRAA